MKKVISLFLCAVLVICCTMSVCAEELTAKYSFGEVGGSYAPDEIITLPVYFTFEKPISAVVLQVSFDDTSLEFQKFESATDKGDSILNFYVVGITENDSSVIGASVLSMSNKEAQFDNTLLLKLRFKVKEDAKSGTVSFDIVKSQLSYDIEKVSYDCSDFESKELKVSIAAADNNNGGDTDDNKGNTDVDTGDEPDDTTENDGDNESSESASKPSGGRPGSGTTSKPTEDKQPEATEPEQLPDPEFSDLAGYEWAEEYIIPLAKQGVIRGTSETTFAPGNNITRADFMVLLMRLLQIGGDPEQSFDDVPSDAYFASAVANAKKLDIAKGADGMFNPYNPITREDLCVLVYRALITMGYLPVVPDNGDFAKKYSDIALISDYALEAVRELSLNEIIGGSNGEINPRGNATRAETAVIIYRISKLIPEA